FTTRDQSTPFGPYGTVFGDPSNRSQDRRAAGELRYEPTLGSFGQLLLRAHGNIYTFDGDFVYPDATNVETYEGQWYGVEARLVRTPLDDGRRLRLSVGAAGERHARALLRGSSVAGSASEPYLNEDHPYTLGAVYALAERSPASFVRVSAGVRLDSYST